MLEKKEERSGKRLIIGLSGGLIVLFGALASLFSVYYSSREAQLTRLGEQLKTAREEIDVLKEENEELLRTTEIELAKAEALGAFVPLAEDSRALFAPLAYLLLILGNVWLPLAAALLAVYRPMEQALDLEKQVRAVQEERRGRQ